jgi:hypothetical protein
MRIITKSLLVVALTLLSQTSLAIQFFDLEPIEIKHLKQVHLDVASEGVNRINFDNFRVVKLIGNIAGATYVLSDQGSDLFIAPKLPVGKKIDFSALLVTGDIIDFSLNIIKSQTPYLVKLKFPGDVSGTNKSEAALMIEAMRCGKTDKYYVQKLLKKVNIPWNRDIKGQAQNSYRFKNLQGAILTLENTNRFRSLEITANNLSQSFDRVTAIYIEQSLLPPKGKTKAYIVFKELGA